MPCRGCFGPDWTTCATRAPSSSRPSPRSSRRRPRPRSTSCSIRFPIPTGTFYRYSLPTSPAADASGTRERTGMSQRITIDPITRLEGHGKIDIFLDDQGEVERTRTCRSRSCAASRSSAWAAPAEDMPQITQRICGVCPIGAPHGRDQGARRPLPRRPAAGRATRSASWSTTCSCSRTTRCTSTSSAGRTSSSGRRRRRRRAQHRGRHRQGRPRDRRQGHRGAQGSPASSWPRWPAR